MPVEQTTQLALRLTGCGYAFETGRLALQVPSVNVLNNPYMTEIRLSEATCAVTTAASSVSSARMTRA